MRENIAILIVEDDKIISQLIEWRLKGVFSQWNCCDWPGCNNVGE
jgi:hypothetical protein